METTTVKEPVLKAPATVALRLMIIFGAVILLGLVLQKFIIIALPLFVALLMTAIGSPIVSWMVNRRVPQWLASLLVLLGGIGVISIMGYFITQQVIANMDELTGQLTDGVKKIETWLINGPLGLQDTQISDGIKQGQDFLKSKSAVLAGAASTTFGVLGNLVAGLLVALFAFYFFLKDGKVIWRWVTSLFPADARERVDGAGRSAWIAFTKYTQATMLVAAVDAIGIMIVAAFIGVPMVLAVGVLVFLGSFIPMLGGLVTGMIPVLLALVVGGPTDAIIMLIGVIAVQQIEGNVLQPFLLGKFVSIHPLAILLSITAGLTVAGIPGALVAVPLVACANAAAMYLANPTATVEDVEDELFGDGSDEITVGDMRPNIDAEEPVPTAE